MVQLNFMDLSTEAQERLLQRAMRDVERQYGKQLRGQAGHYENALLAEAQRKLYDYTYVFKV
ncbi:hypothetical protein [Maribacter sp. 2307ULW6-5]|uniref:hypothetical protein n=1 Tax=Maribacter sp. 2307ULW6-5 TaxID=3386275 RepID=UPI0039BC4381